MARERRSFPVILAALILLAAGLLLSSMLGAGSYLVRVVLLTGLAGLLWGVAREWSGFRLLAARMRRVAEPGPALAWALAGAFCLVVTVGLDIQHVRFDLTARRLHSLSPASLSVLGNLHRKITLTGVYSEGSPERDLARDVLEVYRTGLSGVRTRLLDPERDPEEARRLRIDFPQGILVQADSARAIASELSESAITQAILRAADPARPAVGLLVGHGEAGQGRMGFTRLHRLLEESGIRQEPLPLSAMTAVPAEVSAVLVLGPATPLLPGEITALREFLQRGGRLGIFLDPGASGGLDQFLAAHGVVVDGRPVRDEGALTRSVGLGPETVAVQSLGEHPIAQGLSSAIVLRGATRVGLAGTPVWGVRGTEVLKSAPTAKLVAVPGPDSVGGQAAGEPAGPLPLGVALEWDAAVPAEPLPKGAAPAKPEARMVVVGDSDFLRDDGIDLFGNREFAARILGWLAEKDFLLRFPPVDQSGTPLRVGMVGLRTIFYLVEVLIPLGMFGLAVLVWARRR